MQSIASAAGVTATHVGRKQGFAEITTDAASLLENPRIDAVVVATRHDSHAGWAVAGIRAGKHVFVEKPLALDHAGLQSIAAARDARAGSGLLVPQVMVGFNRRHSPFVRKMLQLLAGIPGPKACVITVNAGSIPASHWTQDPGIGGGRIVGEACHFIDLARCLVGQAITGWKATAVPSPARVPADCASVTLEFADGSMATLHYLSSGHRGFPKERVEVFAGGRVLQLDNFRRLRAWGWSGFSGMRRWRQDKGQQDCVAAFLAAAAGGPPAASWEELLEVSRVTLEVADGLR
jgi:predicted dehydrogenase